MIIKLKEEACLILKKYGYVLPKKWKGVSDVWHAWHSPFKIYKMTYAEYCNRIIEIENNKPKHEKSIRFKYYLPVQEKFPHTPAYEKWNEAYEKRKEAYEKWNEACKKRNEACKKRNETYEKWNEACEKRNETYEKWNEADKEIISAIWIKECPNCPWDDKKKCMIF